MHNLRFRSEISGLSIQVLNSVFRKSIVPGYQILTSNSCAIFQPFLFDKTKNNLRILNFFSLIFKIWLKYKFFETMFCNSDPWVMWGPTQNLDLIGSAVLTFIGYKQTNKQTEKKSIYIDSKHRLFLQNILVMHSIFWTLKYVFWTPAPNFVF